MSSLLNLRTPLAYVLIYSLFVTGLLTITTRPSHASNNSLMRSSTPGGNLPSEETGPRTKTVDEATRARISEAYSKLPLSFEENRGQVDKEVKYFARGSGYTLFLTPTEAVLALRQADGEKAITNAADAGRSTIEAQPHPTLMSVLRMKLSGANQSPTVRGESEMGAKTNYFKGNDPQKWQTSVARFERVRYAQVYPGIDMICSGQQQRLGYDFEVAPGADARPLALEFTGVERVEIERETGDLLLKTAGVEVRQHKPVAYQAMGGERREVASRYVLKGKRKVGIEVIEYDRAKRLVIDSVSSYSTHLSDVPVDDLFKATGGNAPQPEGASVNTTRAQERSSRGTTQEQKVDSRVTVNRHPKGSRMVKAHTFNGDLRHLPYIKPIIKQRPEPKPPKTVPHNSGRPTKPSAAAPTANGSSLSVSVPAVPAPTPIASFDGLDFAHWGDGYPPDTNGDVGPTYYIQTVNTSIGIYNKSTGARVAAFTFNTFMSQGNFGNLCDTDNYGDPIVLYDTFEDRWIITDFAFQYNGFGIPNPPGAFQCIAVSKTGDPVSGGWNFYSINTAGGLGDYPKFGIWPDGLYMSVNMFDYGLLSFQNVRLYAFNKAQMYAGEPSVQTVEMNAPPEEFTILPANARLQTGTPPAGSPNYMATVWNYSDRISFYKFHVDWNNTSNSTLTGPFDSFTDTSWIGMTSDTVPGGSDANSLETLHPMLMMQNQYSNIGGVESLWDSHTVGATTTQAAVRYYQVKITGGTVEANATQAANWSPDTTNRFMPSAAVDRAGNMAIGYTTSSSSLYPALKYAGRLSTDALNTMSLTETTLYQGTGGQLASCGEAVCHRWGDYSAMTLDPDGCTFWYTNEYYGTIGYDWHTRIGSFQFPQCASNNSTNNYSTYLGGSGNDAGYGIAVDASGNVYVTGATASIDFPTLNQYQTYQGGDDTFVAKLDTNASGTASLLYSTYLGGGGYDQGYGIAVDASGNVYVAGTTTSTDFPTLNQYQTYQSGDFGSNAFVTKLNPSLSGVASLLYSTYLGGSGLDECYGIAVDASGNVYVTGATSSTDFPTLNQYQTKQGGTSDFDAFVAKLNPSLSGTASLLYGTYLGGSLGDVGYGIAVDASGKVYVTGATSSTNFPTLNQYQTKQGGSSDFDAFVAKLNPSLSGAASLLYSTYLGGSSYDEGGGVAVDASGNVYVTGLTVSTNFPTLNQYQTGQGNADAFVTKLNTNASGTAALLYGTYLGGSDYDRGGGITIDASGKVYVTGHTTSTNFPTLDALQTDQGGTDSFVAELNTNASGTAALVYGTYLGGSSYDRGYGIAVDASGNVYVTGVTASTDFPTLNQYQTYQGGNDAFVTKVTKLTSLAVISGRVTSDGTTGISGVTVTLSGSQTGTVVTDGTGNYSFTDLQRGGNYTVTPTKSGLVFDPSGQSFTNLQADQTGVNFTGMLGAISGRVTSNGTTGIAGVTVTLSGSQTGIVVTDSTGSYSFTDLAGGGNYTVTPSKSDLIFVPSERSFTNLQANQTNVNFTTQLATISGRVTTGTGAALPDVTVALTNATLSLTTTTASDGTYSFSNLPTLANYKVKPSKTGYTFNPSDIVLYNLSSNQPDTNFVGSTSATYQPATISGRVTIETPTGVALGGVTVTLTSGPDFTQSTTTASDGTYSFNSLPTRDSYTLTPSKTNYTFSPTQIVLNNLKTSQANTNFVAKLKTYTVSGTVKLSTDGVSDVTVTLTSPTPAGFAPRTATTDSNGAYSLANVPAGRDYIVTPTKPGHQFTPTTKSLTNLSANQTTVNFTVVFYSITGRITRTGTTTGISGVTVTITSPTPANFPARTVQTGPLGNYVFTKLPAGRDYTIEPAMTGYTFTPTTQSIMNLSGNIAAGSSTNFTGTGP